MESQRDIYRNADAHTSIDAYPNSYSRDTNGYTHGDGHHRTHTIANDYSYPFRYGHDRTNSNAFRFQSRLTHTVTHPTKPDTDSYAAKPNSDVHPRLTNAYCYSHGHPFAFESRVTISISYTAKPNTNSYRHAPTNALPDINAGCDTHSDTVTSAAAKHLHSPARRDGE